MDDRMNMRIDQVDARGRAIGTVKRGEVFDTGANFRVVHVLLFNARRELLLQQVSSRRARHPGYWGSSVAGYLLSGETYLQAARRKLRTELGIEDVVLKSVGRTTMIDQGCKKFIGVFEATYTGPLSPNPEDFAALWFVPRAEVWRLIKQGALPFTPTFEHVFDFWKRHATS